MGRGGLFADAVQRIARDDPDRILIHAPSEAEPRLTAAALRARMSAARAQLEWACLTDGAVLLWMAGNSAAFYSLLPAAIQVGAVVVLADQTMPPALVAQIEERFGVAARLERVAPGGPPHTVLLPGGIGVVPRQGRSNPLQGDAAVVKLTSGSAAAPRGVVTTEAQLWHDVTRIVEAMDVRRRDVQLASIPISHSYGLGNLVLPTLVLGTRVVLAAPGRPTGFAADALRYGITAYPATPHLFEHLLAQYPDRPAGSLRLLVSAGAPLSRSTVARAREAWDLKIHTFYGSTETGGIAYDGSDTIQDEGYVGLPLPRTSVEVRAQGRLFIRSGAVSSGYVEEEPADAGRTFVDGGFLTADVGTCDDAGALRLAGRVGSVINVGGLKVDPREVEAVVSAAPGVRGAFVVGVPCASHGEDVVAVVATGADVEYQQLESFCRSRLTRHHVPRRFVFVEALPVNGRGKPDRVEITRRVANQGCVAPPRA